VGQEQGGLQIDMEQVGQEQGVCPAEPLHLTQMELSGRGIFESKFLRCARELATLRGSSLRRAKLRRCRTPALPIFERLVLVRGVAARGAHVMRLSLFTSLPFHSAAISWPTCMDGHR